MASGQRLRERSRGPGEGDRKRGGGAQGGDVMTSQVEGVEWRAVRPSSIRHHCPLGLNFRPHVGPVALKT